MIALGSMHTTAITQYATVLLTSCSATGELWRDMLPMSLDVVELHLTSIGELSSFAEAECDAVWQPQCWKR